MPRALTRPSLRAIRLFLVTLIVFLCLFPASVFTARQFIERENILLDEAKIMARLLDARTKQMPDVSLTEHFDYISNTIFHNTTNIAFSDAQGRALFSSNTALKHPQVTVAHQCEAGVFSLTSSISDRVPIMASVLGFAGSICFLGILIINRYIFPRWVEAEKEEQLSKARLADIAQMSSDWFWELDTGLKITTFTMQGAHFRQGSTILGSYLWDLEVITPDRPSAEIESDFRHQKAVNFEVTSQQDDNIYWHQIRGVPLFDTSGRFMGYRGVGVDLTGIRLREQKINQLQEVVVQAMGSLAETRDNETGNHIIRTKNYVRLLAEQLKDHPDFSDLIDDTYTYLLYLSAPLHDIGKVGIPDAILCKPGKLTDDEFTIMKTHTTLGYEAIVRAEDALGLQLDFLQHAKDIALYHQEKWDGSGYPMALAGDTIPLSARLMALADVYDALISKRVYKPAFSHEKAVAIILEGRGSHFDPRVVDAFQGIAEQFRQIATDFADSDEERNALEYA
jgi:putative two-component system response regulator